MAYFVLPILIVMVVYLFIPRKLLKVGPFNYKNIAKYLNYLLEKGVIKDCVIYIYRQRSLNEI